MARRMIGPAPCRSPRVGRLLDVTSLASITRAALAVLALLLVQACSRTPGMPSGWGPLRFAADSSCPQVYGTYNADDLEVSYLLVGPHLPYDTTRGPVESISLVLEEDSLLTAIAWVDQVPRDTMRLRAGRDFRCDDGWLKPTFPQWIPGDDGDSPEARARRGGRREFMVAVGSKGALVGRLDHHTYDEFVVWCGDGCKGFPIPWTWRTSHGWHRAEQVDPTVKRERPVVIQSMTAREAWIRRKVEKEEREASYGPDSARIELRVR